MNAPENMERLGNCGGPVPGGERLRVLVGEPVAFCPTAGGLQDEDVLLLAPLVPSPAGPGLLDGAHMLDMPPRVREAHALASAWVDEWRARQPKGGA